ncbi:ATP-dependent Clp protease proteolytic subunit [Klebsormidium nitens]|uniref:ATP-dependent Clp protease proteolytic subunit n=1 Tax=Klebsormidium nitens TaxID=105231 RepID=A0A1Y1I382_KLENI|nr:ATP-dependent Clp protease proteolytic subunit [Klebsormidium nitens]|eukprot:GAQ85395.1 ATP-dependent Clp protease proteolytic subunit [Klebsormidium nitens]
MAATQCVALKLQQVGLCTAAHNRQTTLHPVQNVVPLKHGSAALSSLGSISQRSALPSTAHRRHRAPASKGAARAEGLHLEKPADDILLQIPYTPSRPVLPKAQEVVTPRAARRKGPPPIAPTIWTPGGPIDMNTLMLRNRIIYIGSPIDGRVAQSVISSLVTLATVDEEKDIKLYLNTPGGSTYSVLAIYDAMTWVKPDISTVAFGLAASQGALLLSAGTKGKRFAMPNARIMIHQPSGGCGGTMEDVRRQANELQQSRSKLDLMFSEFTGQDLKTVQTATERDRFFSAAEACDFGLIDEILETEY